MERFRRRRDATPGRHHGDRGRRRRARGDRDGDRARRALRPRAAPSAARPRRPRREALDLPAALPGAARRNREGAARDPARDRGRLPHRRGGSAPARRRRRARHPAVRHAGLQGRAASRRTARCSSPRARTRSSSSRATRRSPPSAAKRCGTCFICSSATRRSGCCGRGERLATEQASQERTRLYLPTAFVLIAARRPLQMIQRYRRHRTALLFGKAFPHASRGGVGDERVAEAAVSVAAAP